MGVERIEAIERNILSALVEVRQNDLLKNIGVSNFLLERFGKFRQDIVFSDLAKLPIGRTMPLPTVKSGAILTTNITENTNGSKLFFETCWTPGATLILHKHSDAEERIKIRKGIFIVITVDKYDVEHRMKLVSGDIINIAANEYHQITALEKGRMEIKFTRINGNI